jgi:hypothetical protein
MRAVYPYGDAAESTVKIPSGAAKALGMTSRKVSTTALQGIRAALGVLKSAAVRLGKNSKALEIQGWIDQIYAMEQAAAGNVVTGTAGRASDGSTRTTPSSSGGASRPAEIAVVDDASAAGPGIGLWVAAAALIATVAGGAYWYSSKSSAPKTNGRRRNGRKRRRSNPCCACIPRSR